MRQIKRKSKFLNNSLHQANQVLGWNTLFSLTNSKISLDEIENKSSNGVNNEELIDDKQTLAFDRLEAAIDVDDALKHLTDIEVDVVKKRYGI